VERGRREKDGAIQKDAFHPFLGILVFVAHFLVRPSPLCPLVHSFLICSRVSGGGSESFISLAGSFQREGGLGTEPSLVSVCLHAGVAGALPAY
jgi:hypothetical protein